MIFNAISLVSAIKNIMDNTIRIQVTYVIEILKMICKRYKDNLNVFFSSVTTMSILAHIVTQIARRTSTYWSLTISTGCPTTTAISFKDVLK